MPKPEPTWAQKAQNCQAELDGCNDQLERFQGMERKLTTTEQELAALRNSRDQGVSQLSQQALFWKGEALQAQQREASLQNRVAGLEKALREAPTRDLVETISVKLGETEQERAQAAQQAAECRRQAAGMVQRLQQMQSATEALGAAEQAADSWQRRAVQVQRELDQARVDQGHLAEVERDLAQVTEKYRLAGEHIQRVEARLVEVMPAARALPTARADLAQKTEALEQTQRRAQQLEQALDQAQIDHEELATLRRTSAHQTQRLFEAAAELERKERELTELTPAARALPTVKADLAQVHAELEKVRRQLHEVTRQRDQAQLDAAGQREKLNQLRGQLG